MVDEEGRLISHHKYRAPTSSSYCQPDAGINGVLAERPYKCMAFSDSFHYEAIEDLYSDGLIPFDQDINVLDVNMGGKYECRSCAFAVVIDNLSLYNQHVWYVSQFASNDIPPDQSVGTTTAYMTRHRIYIWDNVKKVEKQLAQTCRSWNDDVIPKACAATMYDVDKDTYACWDAYNNIAATFQNASKKAVEYCYKWRLDSSHGKSLPELVCLS